MRFTAAKKAGDPDSCICRWFVKCFCIGIEKVCKMPLQLSCNNVLVQFLFQDLVLVLVNLDNTVNFTVDVFYKHILYNQSSVSPFTQR